MAWQFVAYDRVATERQGRSGLGLDAQRAAVSAYIAGRGALAGEFTEIENGKKADRPQIAAALDLAARRRTVRAIARVDRQACNLASIANPIGQPGSVRSLRHAPGHSA